MIVPQSTSFPIVVYMVADADSTAPDVPLVTAKTGKTVTVQISKNGGAFATAGAVTEIGNGFYYTTLTSTHTNTTGPLVVRATATDCNPWLDTLYVYAGIPATNVELATAQFNKIADHVLNRGLTSARASGNGDTPSVDSAITALRSLLRFEQDAGSPTTFHIKDSNGVTIGTITVDFATAGSTGASSIAVS